MKIKVELDDDELATISRTFLSHVLSGSATQEELDAMNEIAKKFLYAKELLEMDTETVQ